MKLKRIVYEYRRYQTDWSEGSEICINLTDEQVSQRIEELSKIKNKANLKKYRNIRVEDYD
jgi:hypothetical protein